MERDNEKQTLVKKEWLEAQIVEISKVVIDGVDILTLKFQGGIARLLLQVVRVRASNTRLYNDLAQLIYLPWAMQVHHGR